MLELNTKETAQRIQDWIMQTVTTAGLCKLIIGISGGVDSAITAVLAVQAIGKQNVSLVMMPYGEDGKGAVNDAMLIVKKLQLPKEQVFLINIKRPVDAILKHTIGSTELHRGNVMARVRMIYLFDLAKKAEALVCGTENRTEHYLGYFTRFGDEASDLEPIRNLYKTQVWEVAKYLEIPEKIITNPPTAGLWKNQTDEDELGFTYKDADKVLYYYFDKKLPADQIVTKGIAKEIVVKVLERVAKNDFKHRLPYINK